MRKKIKILSILLILYLQTAFLIHGSIHIPGSVQPNAVTDAQIAIVYSTGGLGDSGFNDNAKKGINDAITTLTAAGKTILVDEACTSGCTTGDITQAIENFASSTTVYDLIIGIGFGSRDGVNASAKLHPSQNFTIVDEYVNLPNVQSITFKEQEGSFLAGAMAAMVSTTNDIAFLGGMNISLINRFLAGYEHGARSINPSITVRATYSPDQNKPFGDFAGGKDMANAFIQKGSDVIFAAAGGTGLGVFDAVEAHNNAGGDKVYAIGVDGDQDSLKPGDILTSMLKRVDLAVNNSVVTVTLGTWTAGYENRGLLENGVGISDMTFTQAERDTIYSGTITRWDKIQEFTKNITSGEIVVQSTLDTANIDYNVIDAQIAIVYSPAGLGDFDFNDQAKKGINDAISTLTAEGKAILFDEACTSGCTDADVTTNIMAFAASATVYDLIIGIRFTALDGINAAANLHPSQNFMIVDDYVDLPNVQSITFNEQEGSFLAGAMAAMVTTTNDIAFLGGLNIPLINRFLAGYEHGARTINPSITVRAAYSPNQNNPWHDLAGGHDLGDIFIQMGSDVIFVAAGNTGLGVFNAVGSHNNAGGNKVYAIGVDSDQDYLKPGDILTSMVKRVDLVVNNSVVAITLGTWTAGIENLGLLENGVGLSEMTFTQAEKNAIYSGSMTRWDKIQEFTKNITTGEIVVRSTLDAADIIWDLSIPPLPAPTGFSSSFSDNTITFIWDPVYRAGSYEIEIADTSSFASPLVSTTSVTAIYSIIDDAFSDGSTYYIRVRAINSDGNPGDWSATHSFNVPIETSSTTSTSSTSESTTTSTTTTSTSPVDDPSTPDPGVPGFTILATMIAIAIGVIHQKKRRSYKSSLGIKT
ncbi:MAG: BMP family ABC transporter substrate-binding protein [Candidatus Kariarchaeaceae archaeon]|jgi:basic membrane protein A